MAQCGVPPREGNLHILPPLLVRRFADFLENAEPMLLDKQKPEKPFTQRVVPRRSPGGQRGARDEEGEDREVADVAQPIRLHNL